MKSLFNQLGLQQKILAITLAISVLAVLVGAVAVKSILDPAFGQIERNVVQDQTRRAVFVLEDLGLQLRRSAKDYATWDDSYAFMQDRDPEFLSTNVIPDSLSSLGIDAMVFVDSSAIPAAAVGLNTEEVSEDSALAAEVVAGLRSSGFLHEALRRSEFSAFFRTPRGLFIAGAAAIVRSDRTGNPRGLVIMARRVSDDTIASALRVPVRLTTTGEDAIGSSSIRSSVPMNDASGRPVAYATFDTVRTIAHAGDRAFLTTGAAGLSVLLLLLLALTLGIRRFAVERVSRFQKHVDHIQRTNALEPLANGVGNDELDRLVAGFNGLVLQLKDARELLVLQSYEQGRSDWAAGALHNLKNALNPVVVLMGIWDRNDDPLLRQRICLAASELDADTAPPERREALMRFLVDGVRQQAVSTAKQVEEMVLARESLQQVLSILAEQQPQASEQPRIEPIALAPLLQTTAMSARHSPLGAIEVQIAETDAVVLANPILLSQVLTNIFTNAAEAIHAWPTSEKRIEVEIGLLEREGVNWVEIAVRDHGQGVESAMAEKLFERGFSTRKDKVGGLGLHWVANTMNSMEGRVALSSDGIGTGATARLTLRAGEFQENRAVPKAAMG